MNLMIMNVLYLGMADDIMSPLLIVPDLTTLFVIDLFDKCFSKDKTWKSQKEDIKEILTNGSDINSHGRQVTIKCNDDDTIHYLKDKAKILKDNDNGSVWKLKFKYDNIVRNLIFYHHRNFLIKWPEDIINIKHVIMIGAFCWEGFIENDCTVLLSMLKTRTIIPYYIYALTFNHKHFPEHLILDHLGVYKEEYEASRMQISDMSYENWIEQIYRPDDYSGDSATDSCTDSDTN